MRKILLVLFTAALLALCSFGQTVAVVKIDSVKPEVLRPLIDKEVKARGIIGHWDQTKQRYTFSMDDGSSVLVKGNFPSQGGTTWVLHGRVASEGTLMTLQEISKEPYAGSADGSGEGKTSMDPKLLIGAGFLVIAGILLFVIARSSRQPKHVDVQPDYPTGDMFASIPRSNTVADEPVAPKKERAHTQMMTGTIVYVTGGPNKGLQMPIHVGENRIGREEGELVLGADTGVSGLHGIIHALPNGTLRYEDRSKFGSTVDGKTLVSGDKAELVNKSSIRVGASTLTVEMAVDAPVPPSESKVSVAADTDRRRAPTVAGVAMAPAPAPAGKAPAAPTMASFGAELEIVAGPGLGRHITVTKASTTLGREDRDILLEEPSVSRRHATLNVVDGRFVLKDDGSMMGTKVNGTTIAMEGQELRDGDRITLGSDAVALVFHKLGS